MSPLFILMFNPTPYPTVLCQGVLHGHNRGMAGNGKKTDMYTSLKPSGLDFCNFYQFRPTQRALNWKNFRWTINFNTNYTFCLFTYIIFNGSVVNTFYSSKFVKNIFPKLCQILVFSLLVHLFLVLHQSNLIDYKNENENS